MSFCIRLPGRLHFALAESDEEGSLDELQVRVLRIGSAFTKVQLGQWTKSRSGPEEISDVFAILFGCTK